MGVVITVLIGLLLAVLVKVVVDYFTDDRTANLAALVVFVLYVLVNLGRL